MASSARNDSVVVDCVPTSSAAASSPSLMRAVVFKRVDKVAVVTMAKPRIEEPRDVIVRVTAAGICGSDLHPFHGREKGLDAGTVMGHEFVGQVVECGSAVTKLKCGDTVFTPFTTCCGSCYFCRTGLACRCVHNQLYGWVEKGKGLHGGQAEYVRVPFADGTLERLPKDVTPEEALLVGDILSTGFYCALQAGVRDRRLAGAAAAPAVEAVVGDGVEHTPTYVVVGCGPVGLMAVLACVMMGVPRDHLFAVDSIAERLAMAKDLGATPLNFQTDNVVAVVKDATQGRGADASLEAVGANPALRLAYDVVRQGGTLSSIGVNTTASLPFTPADVYDKNLTFKCGRCPAKNIMKLVLPYVRSRRFAAQLKGLITHRLPLEEGVRGYELFDKKAANCIKVVLLPNKPRSSL